MSKNLLNEEQLKKHLKERTCAIKAIVLKECGSTNTLAKQMALQATDQVLLIAADHQTGGRGRLGRSFHSPAGTGIYFSILHPQNGAPTDALTVTCAASVAVMRAIRATTGIQTQIKWVNDLLLNEKKVCGILTEAITMGQQSALVIGIGLNLRPMVFPEELCQTAGSLENSTLAREELIAEITSGLLPYLRDPSNRDWLEDYRRHSCVLGREILRIENGNATPCIAEEIDDCGRLAVRYTDGARELLQSGEISIRFKQ